MTKLPAPFLNANATEALAYARDAVATMRRPGGCFHPDAEFTCGRQLMRQYMRYGGSLAVNEIIYFAENGSREADAALREEFAARIDRKEQTGAFLDVYIARRSLDSVRGRGRPNGKAANFVRDVGIALLVRDLMERFGLRASRNSLAVRQCSASTIVARAVTEAGIGIPINFKAVEKIYERYRPAFEPRDRWPVAVIEKGLFS